ncbi:asparagine synthase [Rhizoctonia solani AG-1 IA]|uniref:Asparagine synthase n=1 Tax=Thanatephorus cucumeris (strain AG1-IA) TaxID=983506 RepID=L8WYA9_THACA|nr:asparagine synthase [Rhizoctonia solani AG-1 IA]
MCGIALAIIESDKAHKGSPLGDYTDIWRNLCSACIERGPDWSDSTTVLNDGLDTVFFSSVLHLRGVDGRRGLTRQPHISNDGSVFAWNGEVRHDENDGLKLFNLIEKSRGDIDSLRHILSELEGPYDNYRPRITERSTSLVTHWVSGRCSFTSLLHQNLSSSYVLHQAIEDGWKTLNREMPSETSSPLSLEQIDDFISQLDNSVRSRVENIPSNNVDLLQDQKPVARLGVLFSGGIDSAIVAYLADRHIPRDEPIDLLNVGFENPRTLSASQNQAVQEARAQGKRDKKERKKSTHALEIPAKPPVLSVDRLPKMGTYDVPDRLTGLEQLDELRRLCPHRRWNFECKQEEPRVTALMHPSNTVMDLSLANALYFASRGKGVIYGSEENVYVTPAKVLLSGLGSDELLGGYSRHRVAYTQGGWDRLISELQLDLDRLPARNLGRDDRVISANGRESRYPFLSLVLVSYLAQLPVQIKVDPRLALQEQGLGAGLGDKTLLRLAAERLGLMLASRRTKRAMQFGSRSARMDSGTSEKKGHVVLE